MAPTKRRSSPGPGSSQPTKSVARGDGAAAGSSGGARILGTVKGEEGMGEFDDDGIEEGPESEEEIMDGGEDDSSDDEAMGDPDSESDGCLLPSFLPCFAFLVGQLLSIRFVSDRHAGRPSHRRRRPSLAYPRAVPQELPSA
jgi:hypothetical protein